MRLLNIFIHKDTKEMISNRKLLLFTGIVLIYPIIINCIATTPIIPMETLIVIVALFTTCLGGEFLYCFTANEIKYRIFDIFIISNVGRMRLIICKLAFPFLCSFFLSIMSVGIYDASIVLFPNLGITSKLIGFEVIIPLAVGAAVSVLIEFGVMISLDKLDNATHTLTLLVSFVSTCLLYIVKLTFGSFVFIVISLLLTTILLFFDYKLINLYKNSTPNKKRKYLKFIFPEKDLSCFSALVRKEILGADCNMFTILSLLLTAILPLYVYSIPINDRYLLKAIFRVMLYFICTFGIHNIMFPVLKLEKINKIEALYDVAKIKKSKIYISKAVFPFLCILFGLIVMIVAKTLIYNDFDSIIVLDLSTVLVLTLSYIFSMFTSIWFSKYIYSHQDVRLIKFFIFVVTFAFHAFISLCPYWFF